MSVFSSVIIVISAVLLTARTIEVVRCSPITESTSATRHLSGKKRYDVLPKTNLPTDSNTLQKVSSMLSTYYSQMYNSDADKSNSLGTMDSVKFSVDFKERNRSRPKKRDLKESTLRQMMGKEFQDEWMKVRNDSVIRSLLKDNANEAASQQNSKVKTKMHQKLEAILEKQPWHEKSTSNSDKTVAATIDSFTEWLITANTCSVKFKWVDLGHYFWPRFVRKGICNANPSGLGECTWPESMSKCVNGESKVLHILRWHCKRPLVRHHRRKYSRRHRGGRRGGKLGTTVAGGKIRRSCKWYKVPYPVTIQCKCGC